MLEKQTNKQTNKQKLYLDANQSENCKRSDHASCSPFIHVASETHFLKVIGNFESFEHELPILFVCVCVCVLSHSVVSDFV